MKRILAILLLLTCAILPACDNDPETDTTAATSETVDESVTEEETTEPEKEMFYVRTPSQPPKKTGIIYPIYEYEAYDAAVDKANDELLAASGYAVYNEEGEFLYGLNNEYITNMMFRAKYIVDFARENEYKYGSAAINPGRTFYVYLKGNKPPAEKIVSCDRFVGWVLFEMGYIDQPKDGGMYVWGGVNDRDHNLMLYLEKHNYQRIDSTANFKAGDIVFVNPTHSTGGEPYGAHVFICAGRSGTRGMFYRYDHGSDRRIQAVQPSNEGIGNLFCVYRPTQTTMADIPTDLKMPSERG